MSSMCVARLPFLRALLLAMSPALLSGSIAAVNLNGYKTETVKGAACAVENKPLRPFYIPNNQCTGLLYDLPQHCERLELVKVTVTDYAHVKVSINDTLTSASIERTPNLLGECPGQAMVFATLGCDAHSLSASPTHTDYNNGRYILPPQ